MPILDPLALWGVQGVSQKETEVMVRAAYEMRAVLIDAVLHSAYLPKTPANQALYDRAVAAITKAGWAGGAPKTRPEQIKTCETCANCLDPYTSAPCNTCQEANLEVGPGGTVYRNWSPVQAQEEAAA
jgi:hypothetical protein